MFEALLEQIARGLDTRGIPYMLIGGQAVLLYGEARLTRDVDVSLGVGPEKLPSILEWVREAGWKVLVDAPADFVARSLVLPCMEPASTIRVDLIFTYTPFERDAVQRARVVTVGKTPVRFASAEDLIIHKIVAGRLRDLEDVRSILLKNPGLDAEYIRRWLRELEQGAEESFLDRFEDLKKSAKRPSS
jgi:hypothetical protein